MFLLAGKNFPRSSQELSTAIVAALEEVLRFPQRNDVVRINGGTFPALGRVRVDLSDAAVITDSLPPIPSPTSGRTPGVTASALDVVGQPIRYQSSKANFALGARDVSFDFARDAGGNPMLVLSGAGSGDVAVSVGKDDLQSLLRAAAVLAAKQQGVTIQDLQVNLTSRGPRTLDAEARVKAKKMIMSGAVTLRGRVDIDDELVATLSNLSATGDGMIGTMAAGLLQGKLKQLEGQKIPLTTFSLGDVRLHDLSVSTADGLHVTARFGRA